jgi:hypothetical protein
MSWYSTIVESLQLTLLEWKFFKGSKRRVDSMSVMAEAPGQYEEVEEVCLRRGHRSRRLVRRLVEEA